MFYCGGRRRSGFGVGGLGSAWLAQELVERPSERGGVTVIARGGCRRFRIGDDRPCSRYSLSPLDRVHTSRIYASKATV
jgi:hypothetical protein